MSRMNLLLLDRAEIDANSHAQLRGRRAAHLQTVLRVAVGDTIRTGILDGPIGTARVLAIATDLVEVSVTCETTVPLCHDTLLLAVPRPKVLQRMLEHAAALGFAQIVLFRSWRVEKVTSTASNYCLPCRRSTCDLASSRASEHSCPGCSSSRCSARSLRITSQN